MFEINKEAFSAERVDCVIADIEPEKIASDKTGGYILDGFGDLVFKPAHEDIVDVQILW